MTAKDEKKNLHIRVLILFSHRHSHVPHEEVTKIQNWIYIEITIKAKASLISSRRFLQDVAICSNALCCVEEQEKKSFITIHALIGYWLVVHSKFSFINFSFETHKKQNNNDAIFRYVLLSNFHLGESFDFDGRKSRTDSILIMS